MPRIFKDNVDRFTVIKRGIKLRYVNVGNRKAIELPKKFQMKGDIRITFINLNNKGTYIPSKIEVRGNSPYAEARTGSVFNESCIGTISLSSKKVRNKNDLKKVIIELSDAFESTNLYEQEDVFNQTNEFTDFIEDKLNSSETKEIIWTIYERNRAKNLSKK